VGEGAWGGEESPPPCEKYPHRPERPSHLDTATQRKRRVELSGVVERKRGRSRGCLTDGLSE